MKSCCHERHQPVINGKQKCYRNVFVGIKKNVEWDGENVDSSDNDSETDDE